MSKAHGCIYGLSYNLWGHGRAEGLSKSRVAWGRGEGRGCIFPGCEFGGVKDLVNPKTLLLPSIRP